MSDMTDSNTCPLCDADLNGELIPERYLDYYGGKSQFSRRIDIFDRNLDRVVMNKCPDCGGEWIR